jgi:flavorubredoxin
MSMIESFTAAPDIDVITSSFPIPGLGVVPINAFVLKGTEPILVDTGCGVDRADFLDALRAVIDPRELRWIWLTHTDFDHTGSLERLLAENRRIRVLTTFLGVGIMSLSSPLPLDRVRFLNPGETIELGNRTLTAVRPPTFDNPCTTGFYEHTSGAFFSSDCFGALLSRVPRSATDLTSEELSNGQVFWATLDSPWLHNVDRSRLSAELDGVRRMAPAMILSSHLPPAPGTLTERLLASVQAAPDARPFVGPDQASFEKMLAAMTQGA